LFYLKHINLEAFRNYRQQYIQFHPGLNIITGDNGQGKTNLLEAIFFLSVNRSFRTRRDQELIHFGENCFNVKGSFIRDDFDHVVHVGYRHNQRLTIKVNNDQGHRYNHIKDYPVIVFCPDDLQIISEGPSIRRRFLNLEASRLDPTYLKNLRDYQRVLNQRNRILKDFKNRTLINDYLVSWDQALVSLGVSLIRVRTDLVKALEKEARLFFDAMTGSKEELSLEYASTVKRCQDSNEMIAQFHHDLQEKREQEMKRCSTLLGPHLDDMVIMINGYNTRHYSSQGQKRTAALALKMGEASLVQKKQDLYPIILLDDVFSEFDQARKQHLLNFIRKNAGQCFITSAVDLGGMIEELKRSYKQIKINRGIIVDEEVRAGD